jgi:ATP-dependent DNA helicase RecG
VKVQGKNLIALWAPGGLNRPYKAPRTVTAGTKDYRFFIRRYRNRRIGEFLKELDLTEGRCTGIPKIRAAMERNGSPPPRFSTDEGRTFFLVDLPGPPAIAGGEAACRGT